MDHPGWWLVIAGLVIAGVGIAWIFGFSFFGLGRLPGDVVIERNGTRLYFPIVTCLLLSAVLSALVWVLRHFGR